MLGKLIHNVTDWLRRVVTQPRDEMTRWQRMARFAYDLSRVGAKQLSEDRAAQMAAALAFRLLFGMLPLLVVGTILVRALGGFAQFQDLMRNMFNSIGWGTLQVSAVGENGAAGQSMTQWFMDEVVQKVDNFNLTAITWVGVAVLVYSVISLMVTIESCFNTVVRAPEGRSWARRIPIYWTVVTLAPGAIALTMFVNHRFDDLLTSTVSWAWALSIARFVWSIVITWLVMLVIYKLMPNLAVATRPAMIGALVAAILIEIGKRTLGAYLGGVLSVQQLYGSLGLVPLFMLWVYVMWLVVLFGLEVAVTLQTLRGRELQELEQSRKAASGLVDPAWVIVVMEMIAEEFRSGCPVTAQEISEATAIPEATVYCMLECLASERMIHRLDREDAPVSLAQPMEQIHADRLIEIGHKLVDRSSARSSTLIERLHKAQCELAQGVTLSSLVAAPEPNQA